MKLQTDYSSGVLYLRVLGELDHHSAEQTLREIESAMDRYLPRRCALDMSGLTFMDSSGIAVILRAQKRMRETGGQLWIVKPAPQAKKVLTASGIERIVPIQYQESESVK